MSNLFDIIWSKGQNDECYTPRYAVEPLLEFLEPFKDKIIWCPFSTDESEFVKVLQENGYKVVFSHISDRKSFLEYEPKHWDLIVDNPPFTDKKRTFKRCLELGKPFALLMTILWLNDEAPVKLFADFGRPLQLLIFDKRIKYLNQSQDKKISYKSVYFCTDFLPGDLMMKKLENVNQLKKWRYDDGT